MHISLILRLFLVTEVKYNGYNMYIFLFFSFGQKRSVNASRICRITPDIGQYGIYELMIHDDGDEHCDFRMLKEPVNPYTRKRHFLSSHFLLKNV